jgi:hypothetical protein
MHLRHLVPYLPQQPGYNKRMRKLADTIGWLIKVLGRETSLFTDEVWVADSTPVECARSRETAKRSELAGFADYGYCACHSRYFWGLRLHLVCTLQGLPVGAALSSAKADERQLLLDILDDTALAPNRAGQTLIADKTYYGREFEAILGPGRYRLATPGSQGRSRPSRCPILHAAAPSHRVDQRHAQGPTRPRTTRRPHPRSRRASLAARSRRHRRDLAQRQHRHADPNDP